MFASQLLRILDATMINRLGNQETNQECEARNLNESEPLDSESACNRFECDSTPELMVCYKDINYHVIKDICIDEGTTLSQKSFLFGATEDVEVQRPSHAMIKTEKDSVTTDETVSDGSIEDSFIDRPLPIQQFGTRSFLRSFIISLDDEVNIPAAQLLDQISSEKAAPEDPTASSAESDLKEDMEASCSFSYKSKVESKIITFNFNSRSPENSRTKEPSVESRDKLDHRNSDSHNLSCSIQVHCQKDACTEESLKVEDMLDQNVLNQLRPDRRNDDDDVSLYASKVNDDLIKRGREKHEHGETSFSDASFITHSGPIPFSGSISFQSKVNDELIKRGREKREHGETSFSDATHSGPIPFSGSISFRSDSSGKSFAFPVLQSEWNSSPVRMTNADRRHFRKHKFWRSGILCCRFYGKKQVVF